MLWKKMCFWTKNKKTTTTTKQKIKNLAGAGQPGTSCTQSECTTESTESIHCSQAI